MTTFPIVYKNELAFSVVQRLISYACGASLRRSARNIFPSSSLQFCSPFPSYIPVLVANSTIDSQQWIDKHTILRAFKVFTPVTCYNRAMWELARGNGEAVFKTLSLIANRQCNSGTLRYCPQCAINDDREFGLAYWHVHHQLPAVYSCHNHLVALQEIRVTRKRFDWWPKNIKSERLLVDKKMQKLTRFASRLFDAPDEYIFCHTLKEIYLSMLQVEGYVTSCGRLRMTQLRESLINYWSPLMHHPDIASVFGELRNPLYPACIFYQEHAIHSPLKHLLLWAFLFKNLNDIKLLDQSFPKLQSKHVIVPVSANSIHHEIPEIINELNQGKSLRQVAANYSHSVAYIKKLAIQNHIHFDSRAQRLFTPECREIAVKLIAGYSVSTISKSYSCSMGAIEQILSQNPDILQLRKLRRYFDKRKEMRSSLLATADCLQEPRRQDIKKMNNKAYMWLFKNDKDWLYNHLPSATPRSQRRIR